MGSKSRSQARKWSQTAAAQSAGVVLQSIQSNSWWQELAKYRFTLSPTGLGIQSSKVIEALLVLTIPIVQRHNFVMYDDYLRLDFPIVVIKEWNEITPEKLDNWWKELSPRLQSFRDNCLTAKSYWDLIIGAGNSSCWKRRYRGLRSVDQLEPAPAGADEPVGITVLFENPHPSRSVHLFQHEKDTGVSTHLGEMKSNTKMSKSAEEHSVYTIHAEPDAKTRVLKRCVISGDPV